MPAVSVIVQPLNTRPGRLWVHTAAPNSTFPVSPPPFLRPLSSGPPFRPGFPPARVALISNSRHVPTVAHFSRNFFRAVQAGGGVSDGRIINTGSIFADHVPRPGSAVYPMTKADEGHREATRSALDARGVRPCCRMRPRGNQSGPLAACRYQHPCLPDRATTKLDHPAVDLPDAACRAQRSPAIVPPRPPHRPRVQHVGDAGSPPPTRPHNRSCAWGPSEN